eukprot:TRINITY_DN10436_c0_g1_i1.p1 TRINITY_DN10436_c0_g1~~TRINITY_DN10436_c0_g1_i1.p1  ORF type:complete len:377 (-),score=71.80 TRINITY_DN10436_c0_g1_i1:22-1152(-)
MGDARCWNEEAYRQSILQERARDCRTVFKAIFSPTDNCRSSPVIVTASSDGCVAIYKIPIQTSVALYEDPLRCSQGFPSADPLCKLQGHTGPAYDVMFYGKAEEILLLSCGDDGRIQVFKWQEISHVISNKVQHGTKGVCPLQPILEFKNPQRKGPWEALNAMPETNALASDSERNHIFSAAGDGCAYSWDIETGKIVSIFKGHSDYLHCIAARPSQNQVITGSEDGTVRLWDCRSSQCIAILDPFMAIKVTAQSKLSPWVSCVALDTSENWLASGCGGNCITLWNLPGMNATLRIKTQACPQDLVIANNQIVEVGAQPFLSRFSFNGKVLSKVSCAPSSAYSVEVHNSGVTLVGGYGGLIDIISEFGSHLSIFHC